MMDLRLSLIRKTEYPKFMRNYIFLCLITLLGSIFVLSCEKNKNASPNCIILSPKTNSKVVEGNSIIITSVATSEQGIILHIVFYINNEEVAKISTVPYLFDWDTEGYEIGMYNIKTVAIDDSGLESASEINIEIIPYVIPTAITDSRDGHTYEVVEIGEQVWMTENLRYKNDLSVYVNNDNANTEEYGYLYMTRLGAGLSACPDECHIPTRDDWTKLIQYLGGENVAGGKLKETGTQRWRAPNQGATNSSGFSARPAGSLTYDNIPEAFGSSARFFTSFYSNYVFIDFDSEEVKIKTFHPSNEYFSIRCIRDY